MQFIGKKRKLAGFDVFISMAYHGQKYDIVETPWRKKEKGDKLLNFVDLQTRVFEAMAHLGLSGEI